MGIELRNDLKKLLCVNLGKDWQKVDRTIKRRTIAQLEIFVLGKQNDAFMCARTLDALAKERIKDGN